MGGPETCQTTKWTFANSENYKTGRGVPPEKGGFRNLPAGSKKKSRKKEGSWGGALRQQKSRGQGTGGRGKVWRRERKKGPKKRKNGKPEGTKRRCRGGEEGTGYIREKRDGTADAGRTLASGLKRGLNGKGTLSKEGIKKVQEKTLKLHGKKGRHWAMR